MQRGEIHALLGENGAGKTTLMNILYGLYHPDGGEIILRGQPTRINSPRDAIRQRIGMIHQHFMLVPTFSVVENVILGLPVEREPLLDSRMASRRLIELSKQYGLQIDPSALVGDLPVGVQQRVEILKALYRGADLLVLDEPTAVLSPLEIESFFLVLRQLVDRVFRLFSFHTNWMKFCKSATVSPFYDAAGRSVPCPDLRQPPGNWPR